MSELRKAGTCFISNCCDDFGRSKSNGLGVMRSFYSMYSSMARIGDKSILDKLYRIYLLRNVKVNRTRTTESNSCLGFSYS